MVKLRIKRSSIGFFLTCVVAACSSGVHAQQQYSLDIRKLQAERFYNKLLHAEIFNLGGIGWAPTMTTEEGAFRKLLESQNPLASFKRLLSEANPEGQLYALYGLYLQDRNAFREESLKLKFDNGPPVRREKFISIEKGKVRFGSGCLLFQQDRRAVIEEMAEGKFDEAFKARNQILKH